MPFLYSRWHTKSQCHVFDKPNSFSINHKVRESYLRNVAKLLPSSSTAKGYRARSPFESALKPIAQLEGCVSCSSLIWTETRQNIRLLSASKEDQNGEGSSGLSQDVELVSEWRNTDPCCLKVIDADDPTQTKLGEGRVTIELKSKLIVNASQFIKDLESPRERNSYYHKPTGSAYPVINMKFDDFAHLQRSIPDFISIKGYLDSERKAWLGDPGDNLIEVKFSWEESGRDRSIPVSVEEVLTADFTITNCQWR
ncbi:uncharacterized protein L199_003511 [Kwoniella botswanensis]|uniref:uncharacterized protein n=1 Tax=Kwoniella botswanensis TaxID=1268659 RepID=UPI00315D8FD5